MNKDKCDCQGLMMAALAIGAGLGVIAGMAIYASAYPALQTDKWAAWVQAIGSILAIAGAVYAAREGVKATARLKEAKQNKAVLAIIETFIERVDDLAEAASAPYMEALPLFSTRYSPSSLDAYLRAIDAVPVLKLSTPSSMSAMLGFQFHSRLFLYTADAFHSGPWADTNPRHDQLVKAKDTYDKYEKLYGIDDAYTRNADEDLSRQVCSSIQALSNFVKVQAGELQKHAQALRRELA